MALFFYVLSLISSLILLVCLPQMWWDISWSDIFTIISGNNEDINQITDITKIMQALGLTETNLKSWTTERLLICLGIFIALIIAFTVLYKLLKLKFNNNSQKIGKQTSSNEEKTKKQELSQKEKIFYFIIAPIIFVSLLIFIIVSIV